MAPRDAGSAGWNGAAAAAEEEEEERQGIA